MGRIRLHAGVKKAPHAGVAYGANTQQLRARGTANQTGDDSESTAMHGEINARIAGRE